jgi:FMNH2-dependent dimethyl sulfone monooxygenase
MQFGLYAPIPMVTVGSPEAARAVAEALHPLPAGRRDAQFDHGLELLLAADEVGFELCLFAERHLGHDIGAWVMASAIASRFERMRALVAVHPGLWDPVIIAKLAVSLDRICGGRMALNVVNGFLDEEFRMFGGTVLQGEERYKRTEEFIAIMRGLWENETFTFHGSHYNLENGQLLLKPASSKPPEIYSVSKGDRGRDFIAQHCDWWFVDSPKDAECVEDFFRGVETSIVDMNRRCERFGRKVRYAITPFLVLGESTQSALDNVIQRIFEFETGADIRKIEGRMIPATKAGCIGPANHVLAQLRRYQDIGVELVLCKVIPTAENVRRIGAEIITPLKQARRAA